MTNIIILCSGPPKKNRDRHLEIFNNKILIDDIIDKCTFINTNLYVIINKNNIKLKNHLLTKNVELLETNSLKIYDTFKLSLSLNGKCILVCGDLINLNKTVIEKFIQSDLSSALCKYKNPWGRNIISKNRNLIRRADIGDAISMFTDKDKEKFLSKENYENSIKYNYLFYPNKDINDEIYNDIGTHMTYSFFKELNDKNIDEFNNRGLIFCEQDIYNDND